MSNGHACCLYGVCCPPSPGGASPQAVAIAKKMAQDLGWSADRTPEKVGLAAAAADWFVANFDVAPKGLTETLVELYGPLFAEREAKQQAELAGTDAPEGGAAAL